jgi:methyl coenzyme M reductase alpha subunit
MFLTYQTYMLSISAETPTSLVSNFDYDYDYDYDYDSESNGWNQYYDIESQKILNSKNRYHILKTHMQFRQIPINKIFNRKKNDIKNDIKIDILEPIKEYPELFEDIESGSNQYNNLTNANANANTKAKAKAKANANAEIYLIKIQQIFVTSLIYISHIALIIFLVKN